MSLLIIGATIHYIYIFFLLFNIGYLIEKLSERVKIDVLIRHCVKWARSVNSKQQRYIVISVILINLLQCSLATSSTVSKQPSFTPNIIDIQRLMLPASTTSCQYHLFCSKYWQWKPECANFPLVICHLGANSHRLWAKNRHLRQFCSFFMCFHEYCLLYAESKTLACPLNHSYLMFMATVVQLLLYKWWDYHLFGITSLFSGCRQKV